MSFALFILLYFCYSSVWSLFIHLDDIRVWNGITCNPCPSFLLAKENGLEDYFRIVIRITFPANNVHSHTIRGSLLLDELLQLLEPFCQTT
jgi:hypothetical protein